MQQELRDLQPVLARTVAEVEGMMVQIAADKTAAAGTKAAVEVQEAAANEKAARAKAIAEDAQVRVLLMLSRGRKQEGGALERDRGGRAGVGTHVFLIGPSTLMQLAVRFGSSASLTWRAEQCIHTRLRHLLETCWACAKSSEPPLRPIMQLLSGFRITQTVSPRSARRRRTSTRRCPRSTRPSRRSSRSARTTSSRSNLSRTRPPASRWSWTRRASCST
jgi:hypothetical protein